jgi:hypothetical protein
MLSTPPPYPGKNLLRALAHPDLGQGANLVECGSCAKGSEAYATAPGPRIGARSAVALPGGFRLCVPICPRLVRHGYERHPLETAARLAEQNDFFLIWAEEIIKAREKT